MGPEASLQLLHLSKDASIDDVHRAYADLHHEISCFHRESGEDSQLDFKEDVELLTCAYECAVSYLSNPADNEDTDDENDCTIASISGGASQTKIDLPINRDDEKSIWGGLPSEILSSNQADQRTVEEAMIITSRRLRETESAIPGAQEAVNAAMRAMEKAKQRVESAKQANLNTMISAKSAKIRALLLDVEAKKAEKNAHAVAERARARAVAAKKVAEEARQQVDQVKKQVIRAKKSEEAATADVICAEDRMEREMLRLKSLEQKLLETRNCMRMFQETTSAIRGYDNTGADHCQAGSGRCKGSSEKANGVDETTQDQILSELQHVEVFDDLESQAVASKPIETSSLQGEKKLETDRRRFPRIVYPANRHPIFTVGDKSIPVLDLSPKGIRLDATDGMNRGIVRGSIDFPDQGSIHVAGRVIRNNAQGIGIKLVTRVSNRVLEKEKTRLVG
jgi:hypothetical protein